MNFIKKNTPDSAVILFPDYEQYKDIKGIRRDMSYDKWNSYYLHPRRSISAADPKYDSLRAAGVYTHLAIINKKGYDLLPYKGSLEKAPKFTIIALKKDS